MPGDTEVTTAPLTVETHFGRRIDEHGNIVFEPFRRPGDDDLLGTDALLIGQLKATYAPETTQSECLVITTLNATYLPNVNLGQQTVICRKDGRWGPEDWTLWPQWYFEEYNYFPFIRRRPPKEGLHSHPLRLLWWEMTKDSFVEEPGCALTGLGRVCKSIVSKMYELRDLLMKDIEGQDCAESPQALDRMHGAARDMRHALMTLRHVPQSLDNTLLTVVAWQRRYLAARAIIDRFCKYHPSKPRINDEVDSSLMGTVTDQPLVVLELFGKGVPVWYVRRATAIPQDINVVSQAPITNPHPDVGVVIECWPGAPVFYTGPHSPGMYFATGRWCPGSIDLSNVGPESWTQPQIKISCSSEASLTPSPTVPARRNGVKPYSKPKVANASANQGMNINLDRFKVSDSFDSPKTTSAWTKALERVNVNVTNIIYHDNRSLFRGFAFPDGPIFLDQRLGKEYLLAWLVIRTPWLSTLTGFQPRQVVLPSPQQWRSYLRGIAIDYELQRKDNRQNHLPPSSGPTRTARCKQKSCDGAKEIFTIPLPGRDLLSAISWNGRTVWTPENLNLSVVDFRMAIWDAHEHNFRAELFSLDRCIMSQVWGDPWLVGSREKKVRDVFFEEATLMLSPPRGFKSIASEEPIDRCFYVDAFRRLLADWPGKIPRQLAALEFCPQKGGMDTWNFRIMHDIEHMAFGFYCQTFFNYFGRAPSVPHTYPRR